MKKTAFLLAVTACALLTFSCKKENTPVPPPVAQTSPYIQLAAGNYWVYQWYDVDASGNATPRTETDSSYIEKDTVIQGKTYFKLVKGDLFGNKYSMYLRDSMGDIVTNAGARIFSATDFTDNLLSYYIGLPSDTVAKAIMRMEPEAVIPTPYGLFTVLNAKTTFYMYPGYTSAGAIRYMHAQYAPNVGLVVETAHPYISNPNYYEKKLLRYQLQ